MNVAWSYTGLSFQHTKSETDDPTAYEWQFVSDREFIIHAANLYVMRLSFAQPDGTTPPHLHLWSVTKAPSREDKVRT